MGCGVAGLAGFDCGAINTAIQALYALFAIAILFVVLKLSARAHRVRNVLVAVAVLASPFVWALYSSDRDLDQFRANYQEFQALCYERAHEKIARIAVNPRSFVLSPESEVKGAFGGDLFYGVGRPKEWAGVPVNDAVIATEGAYELRYTYQPEKRIVGGVSVLFHGVRQQVIDLSKREVIAERVNFLWGTDFSRSAICLGSDWYAGNTSFAERVLGPKNSDSSYVERVRGPSYSDAGEKLKPEEHVKAKLVSSSNVDIVLENYELSQVLPPGSVYDYYNRTIVLPEGKFRMLMFFNAEPIPIVASLEQPNYFVFVLLPHGFVRNRLPREILFNYRSKNGREIRKVFVQIPPDISWFDGWGFDPGSVHVSKNQIIFSLFGEKRRTGKYSDQPNEGRYGKRYSFRVSTSDQP